jgi:hypothetical protein
MEEIYSLQEGHTPREGDSSHLVRVYQAVRDGEWTLDDFKDFVSVVRNEAKFNNKCMCERE